MKNIFKKISYGIFGALLCLLILGSKSTGIEARAEYFEVYKNGVFEYHVYPYSNAFTVYKLLGNPETVTIPSKITYKGKQYHLYEDEQQPVSFDIFKGKTNLKKVVFAEGIERITGCRYAPNVQTVVLPSTAKIICAYAFVDCKKLTDINIPESVYCIGISAFSGSGIKSIKIPSQVKRILSYTFSSCKDLESVELQNGLLKIGQGAFWGSGLKSITLPKSVKSIEYGAFEKCANLQKVKISSKVEYIEHKVFKDCTSLKSVSIKSKKLKRIGIYSFEGTPKKIKFSLPSGKKSEYKKMIKKAGAKKPKFK